MLTDDLTDLFHLFILDSHKEGGISFLKESACRGELCDVVLLLIQLVEKQGCILVAYDG